MTTKEALEYASARLALARLAQNEAEIRKWFSHKVQWEARLKMEEVS